MKKLHHYYKASLVLALFTFSFSLFAQPGQVLNFNGTGSYCSSYANSSIADNFTMEARVKWAGTTGQNECIILNGSACCTGYAIYINHANNDSLALNLGGISLLSLNAKLTVAKWQMLTLVRSSGKWAFYVDGVATKFTSTVTPNTINVGVDSLMIGATAYNNGFFSGSIDQAVIWGRPLCAGEITARLACQVSVADASLLGLYTFNEGVSGANNTAIIALGDSSGNGNDLMLNYFTLNGASDNWLSDAGALNSYCSAYTPLAIMSTYNSLLCSGMKDSLSEQPMGTGPFTYNWSNGSTKDTDVVSPALSTVYTVKVTDAFGCFAIDTDPVTVFKTPVVSITGKSTICAGVLDTLITNATGQGLMQYQWSTFDITKKIIVQPLVDTSYTVWVTDTNYCIDSAKIAVTVKPSPVLLGMDYSNLFGGTCLGVNDTLWEPVTGGPYTYTWSNGSTKDTIIVSPTTPTKYKIIVSLNTCSQADSTTVTVFTPPVASVTGTTNICPGANDTLKSSATGVKPFQYIWSTYQQSATIVVNPTVDSTFIVWITDGHYCMDSASITVHMNSTPAPIQMFSSSHLGICPGVNDTIWAKVGGSGPYTYAWSNGATHDTIIVAPHDTTTYSIKVTEIGGCSGTDSLQAIVFRHVIKILGGTTGYTGKADTLTAIHGSHFNWTGNIQSDTDYVTSTHIVDSTIMVTGLNSYGCPDTAYFTINVVIAGIDEVTQGSTAVVYPNPAYNVLNISFEMNGLAKNAQVEIIDITGRTLIHSSAIISNGKVLPIDVSSLMAGNYFVRVLTAEGVQQVVKFIKQ